MDKIHDELKFIEQIMDHADYMIKKQLEVLRMYDYNNRTIDPNYSELVGSARAYMDIQLMCWDIIYNKCGITTQLIWREES